MRPPPGNSSSSPLPGGRPWRERQHSAPGPAHAAHEGILDFRREGITVVVRPSNASALMDKAKELVRMADAGYRHDELIAIMQTLQ